jgi:hypothetical protein
MGMPVVGHHVWGRAYEHDKKVGWVQLSAPLYPLKKNVMIWLAQLVEVEALNVMEAS